MDFSSPYHITEIFERNKYVIFGKIKGVCNFAFALVIFADYIK
jgi:hypothetical protein